MKFDKVFRGTWNDKRSELHSSNLSCRWVYISLKSSQTKQINQTQLNLNNLLCNSIYICILLAIQLSNLLSVNSKINLTDHSK